MSRRFGSDASRPTVTTASRTLRANVRWGARKRSVATCCEMVDPRRATRPRSAPCASAFRSSSKSNPAWPKKPPSSAVVTARTTCSGSSAMGTKSGFAGPTRSAGPRPPASSGGRWTNGSASGDRAPRRAASRILPRSSAAESVHSAALDLGRMREAARRGARSPLADPFVHRPPLDAGGRGPALLVGPANPDFVPIAELPEHVVRAVTTAEDGGFFGHAGFDFEELRNALAQGAERGRVVRGGSTISQQVAKNLFLGPERTFARKVREAVVTVGLEASLPKRRLMEIYLNVAEWGPGLWGIDPAARHWFGKDA